MNQLMFAYALTMNIAGIMLAVSININPTVYAVLTTFPLLIVLFDMWGMY